MSIEIPNTLSSSQLDSFSDCRLQWYWRYPKGYTPIQRSFHLDLGIGVHEALEEFYTEGTDPIKTFKRWYKKEIRRTEALLDGADDAGVADVIEADLDTLREAFEMGLFMLKDYARMHTRENFEIIQAEELFEVPIPKTDWMMKVKLDLLVRDHSRGGKIYVVDHKTFTSFDPNFLRKSHQFVMYKFAAEILLDEEVAGVIYNGIRKPKSEKTKLGMFERHYIDVTDQQVKLMLRRVQDMHFRLTQGKLSIFPEPSPMKCRYCAFKDPCEAYMVGEDYKFLLANLFTKRGDRVEIEEEV